METKTKQTEFCKKLAYGNKDDPTVIYGIVLEEDNNGFLVFRTGKREYKISRAVIISFEDTEIPFKDNNGGGQ